MGMQAGTPVNWVPKANDIYIYIYIERERERERERGANTHFKVTVILEQHTLL